MDEKKQEEKHLAWLNPHSTMTVYNNRNFFYFAGNMPPTYLLKHLPGNRSTASVLMLGCGDLRDLLWTLACEDCQPSSPRHLEATAVDHEAGVFARSLIVLELFLDAQANFQEKPRPGEWGHVDGPSSSNQASPPAWLSILWGILYNHLLTKEEEETVKRVATRLYTAMEWIETWLSSRLGGIVGWATEESMPIIRGLMKFYSGSPTLEGQEFHRIRQRALDLSPFGKIPGYINTGNINVCLLSGKKAPSKSNLVGNPTLAYTGLGGGKYICHYGSFPFDAFFPEPGYVDPPKGKKKQGTYQQRTLKTCLNQLAIYAYAFVRVATGKSRLTLKLSLAVGDALQYCQTGIIARQELLSEKEGERSDSSTSKRIFHRSVLSPNQLGSMTLSPPPASSASADPYLYDTIATSNLFDSIGTVNLLLALIPLLAPYCWATVETQYLASPASVNDPKGFIGGLLGMDLSTASLLLGLAPMDWMIASSAWNSSGAKLSKYLAQAGASATTMMNCTNFVTWGQPALLDNSSDTGTTTTTTAKKQPPSSSSSSFPRVDISPQDFAAMCLTAYRALFSYMNNPRHLAESLNKNLSDPAVQQMIMTGAKVPQNTSLTFVLLLAHAARQLNLQKEHFKAALDTVSDRSGFLLQAHMVQEQAIWAHLLGLYSEEWLRCSPMNQVRMNRGAVFQRLIQEDFSSVCRIVFLLPRETINRLLEHQGEGSRSNSGPLKRPKLETPAVEVHITCGDQGKLYQTLHASFVKSVAKEGGRETSANAFSKPFDDGPWIDAKNFWISESSVEDPKAELMVTFLATSAFFAAQSPTEVAISLRVVQTITRVPEYMKILGPHMTIYETTFADRKRTAILSLKETSKEAWRSPLTAPIRPLVPAAAAEGEREDVDLSTYRDYAPPASIGLKRSRLRLALGQGEGLALIDHIDFLSEAMQKNLAASKGLSVEQAGRTGLVLVISKSFRLTLPYPFPVDADTTSVQFSRKRFFIELTVKASTNPLPKVVFRTNLIKTQQATEGGRTITLPGFCCYPLPRIPLALLPSFDPIANYDWANVLVSAGLSSKEEREFKSNMLKGGALSNYKGSIYTILNTVMGADPRKPQGMDLGNILFNLMVKSKSGEAGGIQMIMWVHAVRLDPTNASIALDCCVLPLQFLHVSDIIPQLQRDMQPGGSSLSVSLTDEELLLWKHLLPVAVERAQMTWQHTARCEYLTSAKGLPLTRLEENGRRIICSCSEGKDLPDEFKNVLPTSKVRRAFSRAMISPSFSPVHEVSETAGVGSQANEGGGEMEKVAALRSLMAGLGGGGGRGGDGGGGGQMAALQNMMGQLGGERGGKMKELLEMMKAMKGNGAASAASSAQSALPTPPSSSSRGGGGGSSSGSTSGGGRDVGAETSCGKCGKTGQMLRCSKCQAMFYCGAACQRQDWPTHKKTCRKA